MAVADDAGPSIVGLERRMPDLRQEIMRAMSQDLGELIPQSPWLNQLDNVVVRHGTSLLRLRSEVFKQPYDVPPSDSHCHQVPRIAPCEFRRDLYVAQLGQRDP
jgi:hypothetical protein